MVKTYGAKQLGTVNGRDIYDFWQKMADILELDFRGTIKIYPAEKLDENGDADQMAKGWTMVDSCITCFGGDTWTHYRMKFTYFAGRYAAVETAGQGQ